jgi:hypothetical protein
MVSQCILIPALLSSAAVYRAAHPVARHVWLKLVVLTLADTAGFLALSLSARLCGNRA